MDKMREEFEAWCCKCGYTLKPAETDCGIIIEGAYGHPIVQLAWECWQESRSVLRVELPENCKGMALTVDEFHKQLDKAGVAYK